jgi:hypothetical protein
MIRDLHDTQTLVMRQDYFISLLDLPPRILANASSPITPDNKTWSSEPDVVYHNVFLSSHVRSDNATLPVQSSRKIHTGAATWRCRDPMLTWRTRERKGYIPRLCRNTRYNPSLYRSVHGSYIRMVFFCLCSPSKQESEDVSCRSMHGGTI